MDSSTLVRSLKIGHLQDEIIFEIDDKHYTIDEKSLGRILAIWPIKRVYSLVEIKEK